MSYKEYTNKIKDFFPGIKKSILSILKDQGKDVVKLLFSYIFIIIISVFIYGKLPSNYSNERIAQFIKYKIGTDYDVQIQQVDLAGYGDGSLLVIANDKNFKLQCSNKSPSLKPPIIQIYERKNQNLLFSAFSIPYNKKYEFRPQFKDDNTDLWIYKSQVLDLNNEGKKQIIFTMLGNVCGSGTNLINFVIDNINGNYKEVFLPNLSYNKECVARTCLVLKPADEEFTKPIDLINNDKKISINIIDTDTFIKWAKLGEDDTYRLILGHPQINLKDDFECHWCDHKWAITVLQYDNGNWLFDNSWNHGNPYIVNDKISLAEALGYREIPHNMFGFIAEYYLDNPYILDNGETLYESTFTKSRTTSTLYKIVLNNYGK
ncbi:MAG: hypothetical protein HY918_01915 [Candidatus Doudnabacteria bacterium]|nr:hypothetical protein [Candidatus Doudnabacteria bacterium]